MRRCDDSLYLAKAKQVLKELSPRDPGPTVIVWLVKFYNDSGGLFLPQVTQRRRRVHD